MVTTSRTGTRISENWLNLCVHQADDGVTCSSQRRTQPVACIGWVATVPRNANNNRSEVIWKLKWSMCFEACANAKIQPTTEAWDKKLVCPMAQQLLYVLLVPEVWQRCVKTTGPPRAESLRSIVLGAQELASRAAPLFEHHMKLH